ncbi:MAG: hypothetical protein AB7O52_04235 [Planctomycetota bacterium]
MWSEILRRVVAMREQYTIHDPIEASTDYFSVRVSDEKLAGTFSVMLQSVDGWLLEFENWKFVGGQGVF